MKKIPIFITGCLLALSLCASAMQPQVLLRTGTNYDVKVDGILYAGGSIPIPYLNQGTHTVEVYEVSRGLIVNIKRKVLIYSSTFELRNNDVIIEVNPNKQVRIYESNNNYPVIQPGNGNDNNRDWKNNRGRNRDDNNNEGDRGRGHKYGHYKKMKHHDKSDDNSDDDNRKEKDD